MARPYTVEWDPPAWPEPEPPLLVIYSGATDGWPSDTTVMRQADPNPHADPVDYLGEESSSAPMLNCRPRRIMSCGSLGHWEGDCRPCRAERRRAGSCYRGVDCLFCHLCGGRKRKKQVTHEPKIVQGPGD